MAEDDIELQQELVKDATATEEWVLQTQSGTTRFEMQPLDRVQRAEAQNALPDSLFDEVAANLETGDDGEFSLENVDLADLDLQSLVFPPEAVKALQDALVASLDHDRYIDEEIREIVEAMPDQMFYQAAFQALELGTDTEGVEAFRPVE